MAQCFLSSLCPVSSLHVLIFGIQCMQSFARFCIIFDFFVGVVVVVVVVVVFFSREIVDCLSACPHIISTIVCASQGECGSSPASCFRVWLRMVARSGQYRD